jgi:hypothetical protein
VAAPVKLPEPEVPVLPLLHCAAIIPAVRAPEGKFGRLPKIDAGSTPARLWDAPLVGGVAALASSGAKEV